MQEKKKARLRRGKKCKMRIRELELPFLRVHRTPRHMYAQVFTGLGDKTLVAASTLEKDIEKSEKVSKTEFAKMVGKLIAKRAIEKGINRVAFDRSGFAYHGRVKALADAAREGGLTF